MWLQMNLQRIIAMLSAIGPAVLISVELFDPASIVTSAASGAAFGLEALWSAFYSGILLIFIQEISARLGVVTSRTLAEDIHLRYGRLYSYMLFFPLAFLDLSTLTAEVIGLSIAISFMLNVPYAFAVMASVLLSALLISSGSYEILERLIMFLVTAIFFVYFYFLLASGVNLPTLLYHTIVPPLDQRSFYYAEAIMGASIMPTYIVLHSGLVYEKGWIHHHQKDIDVLMEKDHIAKERVDSIFSLLMGTMLNVAIITSAALLIKGGTIGSFSDMALPFLDKLGAFGLGLFSLAFAFAGISAIMTVGLGSVYNTFGFLGIEERMRKRGFRLAFVVLVTMAGVASLLPNRIQIMVLTQYLNGVLLPFVVIPLVLIARDEKVMGKNRMGKFITVPALATIALTTSLFFLSLIP